jgi:hypothetical protein
VAPRTSRAAPTGAKRYIEGKVTFGEAYEDAVDAGGENYALKRLRRFREWLVASETEDDLLDSPKQVRDRMLFEIREIEKKTRKLHQLLEVAKSKM